MKYRQIITFMLLGLFLNGCSTYRNYERPVDIRTDGLYGGGMTDSASWGVYRGETYLPIQRCKC